MNRLSHTDDRGRARMVDVGGKPPQHRVAKARGRIAISQQTIRLIEQNEVEKGDVLTVAKTAGIQAAKRTPHLIPLCHPLPLDNIQVDLELAADAVVATSTVRCTARTGVEMEALTAVSVALLTVYDMCKAVDTNMDIGDITLLEKTKHDVKHD